MLNYRYINSVIRKVFNYDGHKIQEIYTFYTGEFEYLEEGYYTSIRMKVNSFNNKAEPEEFFIKSEEFELSLDEMDNLDKIINLIIGRYSQGDLELALVLGDKPYSQVEKYGHQILGFELTKKIVYPALKLWCSSSYFFYKTVGLLRQSVRLLDLETFVLYYRKYCLNLQIKVKRFSRLWV